MKLTISALSTATLLSSCSAWKHTSGQDLRSAISGNDHALVACNRTGSQALEPEWTSVASSHDALMSVDCASESALCDEHNVISYPAIRYFDGHGQTKLYRGPRRASAILSFLKRADRPAITALDEAKSAAFQSVDDVVFIAHVNARDEHIANAYEKLAAQYSDRASFGSTDTEGATTVECYNNRDEQKFTLSALTAIDALPKLVDSCLAPLIGEFTRGNEMDYLQSGKSLVLFFSPSSAEREAYVSKMRPVAKMYKEYLSFVTVDADEYADFVVPLGLIPGVFPALAVQNPPRGQTFPFAEGAAITPESVGAFVMDIVQGKVKPWDGQPRQRKAQSHDEL
ncbi:thioredoxin-like protein [Astrocystis sublimbata]|nr:thioredoxin-like protein [Astrocystis sublimbata]